MVNKKRKTKELYTPFIYATSFDASIPQMDISNQNEFYVG